MTAPRVVAVGGGHGLAASLRALRTLTNDLTAVVSVADDGGSTGRLLEAMDLPALGDLRKALLALADADLPLARAMTHRFERGDVAGHAMGNLLIGALAETGSGLVAGLAEVGDLLGVVGTVLPATDATVTLQAVTAEGDVVDGQAAIAATPGVVSVSVQPANSGALPQALDAISAADAIVLGPGSIFTSVLAATAVKGVADAIERSSARSVYVCNLHPQPGEGEGFGVADHVAALERHGVTPDVTLFDPSQIGPAEGVAGARAVECAAPNQLAHDPALLANALAQVI